MRQDIRLFIGDKEVEFNSTPQILYNYTETDLTNPSTIKNSFTKSINIEGTQNNNDIFGHFWDLERFQTSIGNNGTGFNPNRKVDFKLFVNGSLYEQGYCKLNTISRKKGGDINYAITLYGGLGSLFANLSFSEGDDSDKKLTLADLDYDFAMGASVENKLNSWNINKDELYNAWGSVCGYANYTASTRYQLINYVPTYCGTPDNFDSDKVLINNYNLDTNLFPTSYTEDGQIYKPILNGNEDDEGWSLGECNGTPLTMWNTMDVRSYLTQPAIRMKYIIRACGNPAINGGYELALDSHFFNDDNPYWDKSYVTLSRAMDLDTGMKQTLDNATMTRWTGERSGDLFNLNYTGVTLDRVANAKVTLRVGFTPSDSTNADELFTITRNTRTSYNSGYQDYVSNGGVIVQLWAMDANNNIVGYSNAYLLSTDRQRANSMTDLWWNYYQPTDNPDMNPPFTFVRGSWKKVGNNYVFCNPNGGVVDLILQLNTGVDFDHLVLKIKTPYTYYYYDTIDNDPEYYPEDDSIDNYYEVNPTGFPMYTTEDYNSSGPNLYDYNTMLAENRVRGGFSYTIAGLELSAEDYVNQMTKTLLTKQTLLGGDKTPADYLISFCKMFGLYFYYDPTEDSSNPSTYPKGVVHIYDRNTFFTDEYEDINNLIDYSKDITITPTLAESKWLELSTEMSESDAGNTYKEKYGYDYNRQLVNTSFNFNSETKKILDGNIFKGGVMVREQNALYKTGTYTSVGSQSPITLPAYASRNGMTYKLFNVGVTGLEESDDLRTNLPTGILSNINNLGLINFDGVPKLQCHTNDNSPSDGSGILVFLNGSYVTNGENGVVDYYITDDNSDMALLNDNTPCHILTNSEYDGDGGRIARKINAFPNFTREIMGTSSQEGNIIHSWNFGHPQETYIPNTFSTDNDSIYDKCWKKYIADLYDVNTKKLNCCVKFNKQPNVSMFRKYFWFSNGIWRLNAIKDYNPNSFDTTQCEFIKVQDVENYKVDRISGGGTKRIQLNSYSIESTGGTIQGTIYSQGGGTWSRGSNVVITYINGNVESASSATYISPATGSGVNSSFSVTIPTNNTEYQRTITIFIDYPNEPSLTAQITQSATQAAPYLDLEYPVMEINASSGIVGNHIIKSNVRTGLTYTLEYLSPATGWVSDVYINETTGQLTARVAENTGYQRSCYIHISGVGINGTPVTASTRIDQSSGGASDLSVQPDLLTFDYLDLNAKSLYVTYGGNWTITQQDQ